jgi:ComEC/Rec2-related protein
MRRETGEIVIYITAACSAAVGFYFGSLDFFSSLFLSLPFASFGIMVSVLKGKNAKTLSAAFLCGAILLPISVSVKDYSQLKENVPRVPQTVLSYNAFQGELVRDSKLIKGGKTMYVVDLKWVESAEGIRYISDSLGKALVFGWELPKINRGSLLRINAELCTGDEKQPMTASVSSASQVILLGYSSFLMRIRSEIREVSFGGMGIFGGHAGGLMTALIWGDRDNLIPEEGEMFRNAGCAHVLALSGMHLGILCGLLTLLINPLLGRKSFYLVAGTVFLYIFIVGPLPSLNRAALMFVLGGFGKQRGRRVDLRIILLLSFLILLFSDPASAFTLSFQLSFLALGGIAFLAPSISEFFEAYIPKYISLPISASIAAQFFTAPLLLGLFGTLRPIGIIAALIMTPLVTVFVWGGAMVLLFTFILPAGFTVSIFNFQSAVIVRCARFFSAFPGITPPGWFEKAFIWVFCIIGIFMILFLRKRFKLPIILKG